MHITGTYKCATAIKQYVNYVNDNWLFLLWGLSEFIFSLSGISSIVVIISANAKFQLKSNSCFKFKYS